MNNEIISPIFSEKNYQGKDIILEGVRIPLRGQYSLDLLDKFSNNSRRVIKLERPDLNIEYRELIKNDLDLLRNMWFDPNDETFPRDLSSHIGFVLLKDEKVVGGIILKPIGDVLFMHQLVAGEEGKKIKASTLLVWHAARMLTRKKWHSIDVGVSYNPARYNFFRHFAVEEYPIILKKPFYTPIIRFSPFKSFRDIEDSESKKPHKWLDPNTPYTFVPRGSYAISTLLKYLKIGKGDKVGVIKTFDTAFVSGCVAQAVENVGATCVVNQGESLPECKAVLLIHEFGIPISQDNELVMVARDLGLKIIEDCAWREDKVFHFSDYSIFSSQKIYDMNYGGLIIGASIPSEELWGYGAYDFVKAKRFKKDLQNQCVNVESRINNWTQFHDYVCAEGWTTYEGKDVEGFIKNKKWAPTVYMIDFGAGNFEDGDKIVDELIERLEQFGIQSGKYHPSAVLYVPIHDNMSSEDVRYMFAVIRGYFNSCNAYVSS
ncbi:hypothetical protein CL634_10170 [bacterium]|nr:hypothetical protein [bacterium]